MSDEIIESPNGGKGKREQRERDLSTPTVHDEHLFDFLESLFYADPEPEQYPERIEINVVSGRHNNKIEDTIWTQQFAPIKATEAARKAGAGQGKPSRERLVALSNLLLFKMQHHCDEYGAAQKYAVNAWSTSRGPTPYMKFPKSLQPSGRYARKRDGEDEDEQLPLEKKFLVQMMGQQREMMQVVGEWIAGLSDRQNREAERSANIIEHQYKEMSSLREQLERSMSLELDRAERREWLRIRREMTDKGWQAVQQYGPLLLSSLIGKQAQPKVINPPAAPPAEVEVLHTFLRLTTEGGTMTPEQCVAAFGDWGPEGITSPGILTPEQATILVHVAMGKIPPDELDKLIPPDGVFAINPQQLFSLTQVFSPEQLRPLQELFMARSQRKQGA